MKKFEHKNKDERRRVLLSKNNELSYTFDNEKLPEGNEAVQANGVGVMAKLQNMNKRVLAVILVIVFVMTVVPSAVFITVKGAEKKTYFTELDSTNPATDQVLSNTYSNDTVFYYYEPDNRTYTYDLTDVTLVPGDTITFHSDSKAITWTHTASNTVPTGAFNVESSGLMTLDEDESTEATIVLNLENEKSLDAGKTYYYVADDGTTYTFEVDGFLGYKASGVSSNSKFSRLYYMKDYPLKNGVDIQLIINRSEETGNNAILNGDQLTRHTIYVKGTEPNALKENAIYLIGTDMGNNQGIFVNYLASDSDATQNDKLLDRPKDSFWGDGGDCIFRAHNLDRDNIYHKVYNTSPKAIPLLTLNENEFFDMDGDNPLEAGTYVDGGSLNANTSHLYSEFLSQSAETGYMYFEGYNGSQYTNSKVFGKIGSNYSDTKYSYAYIYDICEAEGHNVAAMWSYSGSGLSIKQSLTTAGGTTLYYKSNNNANRRFTFDSSGATTSNINIYELKNVYEKAPVSVNVNNLSVDENDSGTLPATGVTYTDSETDSTNGLNLEKTVTGTNDHYKVQLEAYTTGSSLNMPATDIILVLDQSKYMHDDVMFKRDYKNLNTYTEFSDIDLNATRHDDLFDKDTNIDTSGLIGGAATIVGNWFLRNRVFVHNKYIEDPHHPGQYVYLYQKYRGKIGGGSWRIWTNYYTYYFTDCDGIEYESPEYDFGLGETTSDDSIIGQLEFHKVSDPNKVNDTIVNKMYYITDMYNKSDNTASTLNPNLKAKADADNLYMKDSDGTFRKVFVDETNGMYTYYVTNNDQPNGTTLYSTRQGGKTDMVGVKAGHKAGEYGVFQGFRSYIKKNGDLALDPEAENFLSKSLYEYVGENAVEVTAEQVMKESLEDFLLNAHEQALAKSADVHVALVVYAHGAEVKYTLQDGANNKTNMKKPVGTNSVDSMISAIYNYDCTADGLVNGNKATYASETNEGMTKAYTEMNSYKHNKTKTINGKTVTTPSRRYTLLFTAGVPAAYTTYWFFGTRDSSGTYTTGTASGAVEYAYKLKNHLNTTVYSVGLFDNASETKINGSKWYYEWSSTVPCDGSVGSYWGGSWVSNALNYNIDPKDAYATNRMLAYISSDYLSPTRVGLNRGWYHPGKSGLFSGLAGGYGYQITNNFTRNELGYYLSVSPKNLNEDIESEDDAQSQLSANEIQTILRDVFQKLDMATAVPNSELTDKAYLVDGITKYFDFDGAEISDITAQVVDTDRQVDNTLTNELTTTLSKDKKTITVTGFNYIDHYIVDEDSEEQPSTNPRKLVVSFYINRTEGLIGGNSVPTNLSSSAIYDGDSKAMSEIDSQGNQISPYGILVERFEIPKVDLDIDFTHVVKDDSAYYGCEENLADLVDLTDLEPEEDSEIIPNEFVDVEYKFYSTPEKNEGDLINTYTIPAGSTSGTWSNPIQAEGTGTGNNYQPGAISQDNLNSIFQQIYNTTNYYVDCTVKPVTKGTIFDTPIVDEKGNTATVYVFKPHYDVHNDTVDVPGEEYPLNSIPDLDWIGYDAQGEKLTAQTGKTEAETYIARKTAPSIAYNIFDERLATNAMNSTSAGTYPIWARTDFQMRNLVLTPTPIDYEEEQLVAEIQYASDGTIYSMTTFDVNGDVEKTIFYDADGQEMEGATTGRDLGKDEDDNDITLVQEKEKVFGTVTKTLKRSTNPEELTYGGDNPTVTFTNTTAGDIRTDGHFTISLKSHDVTIINHTVRGQEDADYSDKTKAFPMVLTLKDANGTLVDDKTFNYSLTDKDGNVTTGTLTFTNGVATIPATHLKDSETIVLKDILDGYKLTIASDTDDNYYFYYQTGNTDTNFDEVALVDGGTDEITSVLTITDDTVIHTTHSVHEIVVTGRHGIESKVNPFLIAAGVVTVLGGAWLVYMMKRRRAGAEQ